LDWGSAHRKALPTQDNKTHKKRGRTDTETHTHYNLVSTGIRTHDPSVRAAPRPYQFHKVNANMRRMIDRSLSSSVAMLPVPLISVSLMHIGTAYRAVTLLSKWRVSEVLLFVVRAMFLRTDCLYMATG